MSIVQETQPQTDRSWATFAYATLGNVAMVSVEHANAELQHIADAADPANMYTSVLGQHDHASGSALRSIIDGVYSDITATPASESLPVAVVLRNRHSHGRTMAIVGLVSSAKPVGVLFEQDQIPEQRTQSGVVIATAALSLQGFVQAVKGNTKAYCSKPGQPGHAFIDVMRYCPDTDTGLVRVDHKTALAVTTGRTVQSMLEAHEFGAFGRFASDRLAAGMAETADRR